MRLYFRIIILFCVLWIGGCVTYERCVDKYAFVNEIVRKDSTIYIDSVKLDTIISIKELLLTKRDTFLLEKEKVKLQIIKHNDTLIVHSECKNDTIVVPVQKIQYVFKEDKPKGKNYEVYFVLFIAIALLIFAASVFIKFFIK